MGHRIPHSTSYRCGHCRLLRSQGQNIPLGYHPASDLRAVFQLHHEHALLSRRWWYNWACCSYGNLSNCRHHTLPDSLRISLSRQFPDLVRNYPGVRSSCPGDRDNVDLLLFPGDDLRVLLAVHCHIRDLLGDNNKDDNRRRYCRISDGPPDHGISVPLPVHHEDIHVHIDDFWSRKALKNEWFSLSISPIIWQNTSSI